MYLYKRGDVWHCDFTANGERVRRSTKCPKKEDARKRAEGWRSEILRGPSAEPVTIADAADQWFAARARDKKSATDIAQRIKIMLRHIGDETPVSEIGPKHIEAAMQARRYETTRQGKVPTNSTVNRDIIDTTLRPILHYAADILELDVRRIPWGKLKLEEPEGRSRTFSPDELSAYRDALPHFHRPLFDFVARYGVRLSEAFFHPDAFNPETGRIVIRGPKRKNGKPHVVTLLDDDRREMAARATRAAKAGLDTVWFKEMKDGSLWPTQRRGFQSACQKAARASGTADVRAVHDLRHHAATTVLRATGDLVAVQRLLGHEKVTSTTRYAHADDEQVLSALRHTYGTKGSTRRKKANRIK